MNVLFVEDSEMCQTLVKSTTEKEFPIVRLTCCKTLAEARKLVEDAEVVILDLGLPDADHDEVFEWITDCGKPVVIYTASQDPEIAFECVRAGALNVVCKGSPSAQLVMGIYVAMAEFRLQCDEIERRRELVERLEGVLTSWCGEFGKTLSSCHTQPAC